MAKRRVISLFSGAGGLDYGFKAAGFRIALSVDSNADCCDALRKSRAAHILEQDVVKLSGKELLARASMRREDVDVLIGGPPCQPFSKSGFWRSDGARRLADPRARTLGTFMRLVEETLPRVFLLENVQGLTYSNLDEGLDLLLRRISRINRKTGTHYVPHFAVLNAADYGVPQIRHRLFLVAERDGQTFAFPTATHGTPSTPYKTAWDALADVEPDPEEDLAPSGKWGALLSSIPEGQNYLWHTPRGEGLPLFGWRRRYWTFLLKLAKDRPSWTIQANPGPSCGPFHWDNRRLSIRELARLQTFPDTAKFAGSYTSQRRQIGNAVPSLLGEVLAREIAHQLLGARAYKQPPTLLPPDRGTPPRAQRRCRVPEEYHRHVGNHRDHPGEGRGKGAIRRRAA